MKVLNDLTGLPKSIRQLAERLLAREPFYAVRGDVDPSCAEVVIKVTLPYFGVPEFPRLTGDLKEDEGYYLVTVETYRWNLMLYVRNLREDFLKKKDPVDYKFLQERREIERSGGTLTAWHEWYHAYHVISRDNGGWQNIYTCFLVYTMPDGSLRAIEAPSRSMPHTTSPRQMKVEDIVALMGRTTYSYT